MVEITEKYKTTHNPDISYEMPVQFVITRPLKDIDLFIGYLNDHHPALTETFSSSLQLKLQEIVKDIKIDTNVFEYSPENLRDLPELEDLYKKSVLQLLRYEKYESEVTDGKTMFQFKDVLRSYLIPAGHIAEVIVSLLEEGLEFYKNYVDYRTNHEKRIQPRESLEDFLAFVKQQYSENPQDQAFFYVKDGPLFATIKFCLWKEILEEFDPEIAYAVACHFDFMAARQFNENFVLTRTKTVMQGDDLCDFCWQDTRLENIEHPNDEFWENLE